MKVTRIRALRGPNLWSRLTAIEAVVACEGDENAISKLAGFEARLRARFPTIGELHPVVLGQPLDPSALKAPLSRYTAAMIKGDLATARSAAQELPPLRTLYPSDLLPVLSRPDATSPEKLASSAGNSTTK